MCPRAKACTESSTEQNIPCTSPIPTISTCAIATAASMVWPAYTIDQAGLDTGENASRVWVIEAKRQLLRCIGHSALSWPCSSTPPMSMAPTARPTSCSATRIGTAHFQDDRGVVGRVVRLNKHPFTIVGVAPPGFHGTCLFFSPDFFVPMVNQEQIEGKNTLDARCNPLVFMAHGTSEAGSHSGTGVCRSELDRRISGKDLSQGPRHN